MRASGFLEAEHDRAQVGLAQPLRGEPLQHAAFVRPAAELVQRTAFAGDDDDQPRAARLRMAKKAAQSLMRLGLGQPVQIERPVDRGASARKVTLEPPFDRRERRRGGLRRPGGRRFGGGWRRGGGPCGPYGIRRRGQGRAAPPRDGARDLGPERDLLVAQAPQALRGGGVSFTARPLAAEARRTRPDGEWRRRARLPCRRCRRRGRRAPLPQSPSRCPGRS